MQPCREPIGFVNFYSAFRDSSLDWIGQHQAAVWEALSIAATAASDADARRAYELVEQLPPLPRRRNGPLPAFNLLTPVLACLDPRLRSPIINAREDVQGRLRAMQVRDATLVERFDQFILLLDRTKKDALELDVADNLSIERALLEAPGHILEGARVEMFMADTQQWVPGVITVIDCRKRKCQVRFPDGSGGRAHFRYVRPLVGGPARAPGGAAVIRRRRRGPE